MNILIYIIFSILLQSKYSIIQTTRYFFFQTIDFIMMKIFQRNITAYRHSNPFFSSNQNPISLVISSIVWLLPPTIQRVVIFLEAAILQVPLLILIIVPFSWLHYIAGWYLNKWTPLVDTFVALSTKQTPTIESATHALLLNILTRTFTESLLSMPIFYKIPLSSQLQLFLSVLITIVVRISSKNAKTKNR